MSIDPNSHVPIYEQIVAHIRGRVAAGVFLPGEGLPSIRALALELVVNPNTVQRAYQELERQGLLYTRKGLGAFVAQGGDKSAQQNTEARVVGTFSEGIELGRSACMSAERILEAFARAWQDLDSRAGTDHDGAGTGVKAKS